MIKRGMLFSKIINPFCYIMKNEHRGRRCERCLSVINENDAQFKCFGCHKLTYCSYQCKRVHFAETHQYECRLMSIYKYPLSPIIRMWSQLLVFTLTNKLEQKQFDSKKGTLRFEDADIPVEELWNSRILQACFEESYNILQAYIAPIRLLYEVSCDKFFVQNLFYRMIYFTIQIQDFHDGGIAYAIYGFLNAVKHSCIPNVGLVFSGTTLNVIILNDLPEGVFLSEMKASYIELNCASDLPLDIVRYIKAKEDCSCWICCHGINQSLKCLNTNCRNFPDVTEEECTNCHFALTKDYKESYKRILAECENLCVEPNSNISILSYIK